MSIEIKSFTKEQLDVGLKARNEITNFMGYIEVPLEALNTPVKQRKVVSDQSVEEDATFVPVTAGECMIVLFEDSEIAILSTEEEIKPSRYMNASPEWLLHLADLFGVDSILTHSDGEARLKFKRVEKRYNSLSAEYQNVVLGKCQMTIPDDEKGITPCGIWDFDIKLVDKVMSEIERHIELDERLSPILFDMTVDEKKQICRDNGISGYSNLNEAALVTLIIVSIENNEMDINDLFDYEGAM